MSSRQYVAAGLLLLAGRAHAGVDDYAYAWPVQTEGDSAAWQVELTPEVYAAISTEDLRDVEIVNAAGAAVPVAPRIDSTPRSIRESMVALPMFALPGTKSQRGGADDQISLHVSRGADGRLQSLDAQVASAAPSAQHPNAVDDQRDLLLDASGLHDSIAALNIDWNGAEADVNAQFSVSTSDDLQQWRALVASATVLRLSQGGSVLERHQIALHGARAAYLRLRRLDDGHRLTSLVVQARVVTVSSPAAPVPTWITATPAGNSTHHLDHLLPPGDGSRPVLYRYRLPAALAVDRIRLELSEDNSLARVDVLSREDAQKELDDSSAWVPRASLIAFRLREGDSVLDNDELPISHARRARDWDIESATPLDVAPHLDVAFVPDRFVFLAQGAGPYRLLAGSARSRRSDYPVDTALAPLRAKLGPDWQPPLAALGARATLQGDQAFQPAPVPEKPRDWKTWVLWSVLVAAAALIGGLALSLIRGEKKS